MIQWEVVFSIICALAVYFANWVVTGLTGDSDVGNLAGAVMAFFLVWACIGEQD